MPSNDTRDDWLEGVRRWYFGGTPPPGAAIDDPLPAAAGAPACAQPTPAPLAPTAAHPPGCRCHRPQ